MTLGIDSTTSRGRKGGVPGDGTELEESGGMRCRDQVLLGLVGTLTVWGVGAAEVSAAEPTEQVSSPSAALVVEIGGGVDVGGPSPVFEFAGSRGSFVLEVGQSVTFAGLEPGAHVLRAILPEGWRLAGVGCRGGETEVDGGTASVVVVLQQGEAAACTFVAQHEGLPSRSDGWEILPLTGASAPLPLLLAAGITALVGGLSLILGATRRFGAVGGRGRAWSGALGGDDGREKGVTDGLLGLDPSGGS